jgi:putative ABC transport system permease protein
MKRHWSAFLVRLYPRPFRELWGNELEHVYQESLFAARQRGRVAWLRTAAWLVADALRNFPAAWLSDRRPESVGLPELNGRAAFHSYIPSNKGASMIGRIGQDLRYGLRMMLAAPWLYGAAVLTLSVGIGATIAIFSVVNGVLLKPLDYPEEDRLVHIQGTKNARYGIAYPDHELLNQRARSFESMSAYQGWLLTLNDAAGAPVRVYGASVSANYFQLLRARPLLGRLFTAEDAQPGHLPTVVLSHVAWQQFFGGRADAIGRAVQIDTVVYTVVGVAAPDLVDPIGGPPSASSAFVWRAEPPVFERGRADPTWIGFWSIGRLRPNVSVAAAQAEAERLIVQEYGERERSSVRQIATFRDAMIRDVRPTLIALLVAVIFVLLIGCANVANLLLSRATARGNEIALRMTLGASRSRLIGQLLTEGLLLSLVSTLAGFAIAVYSTRALVDLMLGQLPRADEIGIDWRLGTFALALSAATALAFALAPALQLTGYSFAHTLREHGRGAGGSRTGRRLRHSLVVLETALAVVLLTGATLLLRTFWELQKTDPGFDAEAVMFVRANMPARQIPTPAAQQLTLSGTLRELNLLPGVRASGAISDLPMSGAINSTSIRRVGDANTDETRKFALVRAIDGDYFGVMRIPVLRGRSFGSSDRAGGIETALINDELARRMFGTSDALGQRVLVRGVEREIVGVVATVKEFTVSGQPDATLYTPYAQEREPWMRESMTFVVRAQGDSAHLADAMRGALRRANPSLTFGAPRTMEGVLAADVAAPRFRAWLVVLFAGVALLLAGLGIAGVLSYTVAQRLPEIGVRLALGAAPRDVVRLVVGQSAKLAGMGVALGAAGAIAAARAIAIFLYGVQPLDPIAFAVGIATLLFVALAASWLPARRGANVDPALTLRG